MTFPGIGQRIFQVLRRYGVILEGRTPVIPHLTWLSQVPGTWVR